MSTDRRRSSIRGQPLERISAIVQQWFLADPLLFAAWTTHQVLSNPQVQTLRVGNAKIEVNPQFVDALDDAMLREVMKFEAVRIILMHPYERRRPRTELAWEASNIAIAECLPTSIPVSRASEVFGTDEHNHKFFEYYYQLLSKTSGALPPDDRPGEPSESLLPDATCAATQVKSSPPAGEKPPSENLNETPPTPTNSHTLEAYCDPAIGFQNAAHWDADPLLCEQINELVTDIEASQSWGSLAGKARELILASRAPRLDYRRVLRAFRANVLATTRRLTRMKPSRRYGFEYMGSRRDFTTSLLFAIDASGSVGSQDIRDALAIVNRLFKYGVESVDVIWFDTQIQSKQPLTIKRARRQIEVTGRGGTNFQPVMDYLDQHRDYDGLIIFTDGLAPTPQPPKHNRRTRIAWLFNTEAAWQRQHRALQQPGMVSAFVTAK